MVQTRSGAATRGNIEDKSGTITDFDTSTIQLVSEAEKQDADPMPHKDWSNTRLRTRTAPTKQAGGAAPQATSTKGPLQSPRYSFPTTREEVIKIILSEEAAEATRKKAVNILLSSERTAEDAATEENGRAFKSKEAESRSRSFTSNASLTVLRSKIQSGRERRQNKLLQRDRPQHCASTAPLENGLMEENVDSSRPCPLFRLPLELREIIYTHAFRTEQFRATVQYSITTPSARRVVQPNLLQVCHAIRIEAGYMFYRHTRFTFEVHDLNFSAVKFWIERLSARHQQLLSNNDKLIMQICPDLFGPKHARSLWPSFRRFGIVMPRPAERDLSVTYCLLMDWFLWCAQSPHANLKWHYVFKQPSELTDYVCNFSFLDTLTRAFALPSVQNASVSSTHKAIVKEGMLGLVTDLDEDWKKGVKAAPKLALRQPSKWDMTMVELRSHLESW